MEHNDDRERVYIDISSGNRKQWLYNHILSPIHDLETKMLYLDILDFKDQGLIPQIKWKIVRQSSTMNSFNGRCNLCIDKKIRIIILKIADYC